MNQFTKVLPLLVFLGSGCTATKQLVPRPSSPTVAPDQVRITINDNRYAYPPLPVKDQRAEIGAVGRNGSLVWDRPAGRCCLELHTAASSMNGQEAGLQSVFLADLQGGKNYTLDLVRNNGNFRFQPSAASADAVRTIQIPVCILPALDDTGGKCIDLQRYVQAFKLPQSTCGAYFPANIAFNLFNMWAYTKPAYGGENSDLPAIYAAAKTGAVPADLMPAQTSPTYYVLVVVRQFEDSFRIMWLIDSVVDCYVIRAADGKVVYRGTGNGSCRAGALDIDQKFMVQAGFAGGGNSWVWPISQAVKNAFENMPPLAP